MRMFRALVAVLATWCMPLAGGAEAQIKTQWVDYAHGDAKLKAYLAVDEKATGVRPAILIIHAREGMSQKTRDLTEMWARSGYVAFAADIFGFGQGILPKNVEEMNAQTTIYMSNRPMLRARVQAGYDALARMAGVDAGRIALIGYCFGGAVGVEFGMTGVPLALNVSIHGSFRGHEPGWAKKAKGMFLILHGAEDKGFPLAGSVYPVVDDLRAAQLPFHLEVYSGTDHGFSTPKNKAEERANTQSIATTFRTMKELFGM